MISDPVEKLIQSFLERGWESKPFDIAFDIALNHPEKIQSLALEMMEQVPTGATFFDALLSFLPMDDWPEVVRQALNTLDHAEGNKAAENVIEYANLQCLSVLHPHLRTIFQVAPNVSAYFGEWAWRESGQRDFVPLRDLIRDDSRTPKDRHRAWRCLLETRDTESLEFAVSHAPTIDLNYRLSELGLPETLNVHHFLRLIGFELCEGQFRQLYTSRALHLVFSSEYFLDRSWRSWFRRHHPTWNPKVVREADSGPMSFGGQGKGECKVCGKPLHRLLKLDPVPPDFGLSNRTTLDLCICLSCLGWEQEQLFYYHDDQGRPENIGYEGPTIAPKFPTEPLCATQVFLIEVGPRWRWQDWGFSNGRENLHRVGGHPCWIQNADYLQCPRCGRTMQFLLQLDSELPTMDSKEWLWGSGGICYCFWCDDCKVSGFLWQCT
jgi:hypothetical protein